MLSCMKLLGLKMLLKMLRVTFRKHQAIAASNSIQQHFIKEPFQGPQNLKKQQPLKNRQKF